MKKSYWLYKMCLLLGLGICIPVTGNASDIGDATYGILSAQSRISFFELIEKQNENMP